MQKILITGASGYLAHALVPIAAMQADVIGVARNLKKIGSEAMGLSLDIEDRCYGSGTDASARCHHSLRCLQPRQWERPHYVCRQ